MKSILIIAFAILGLVSTCSKKKLRVEDQTVATEKKEDKKKETTQDSPMANTDETIHYPDEKHFKNVRQLTFGGENAEAYFSFDGTRLVFQRRDENEGVECDQIYVGKIPESPEEEFTFNRVSNGLGRTTCSYFLEGDERIIYASTHEGDEKCPVLPDRSKIGKYVWPIYNTYDLYVANQDGSNMQTLTKNNFYDAEATVSPDGKKVVYTSNKSGDLELYVIDMEKKTEKQVTNQLGYDGGAFFSPDSKSLVFRASRPQGREAILEYKNLLKEGLVAPTQMELFVCDIDGKNLRQVTNLGKANWAPFYHPSGEKIIFSSNHESEIGFPFNLYMINVDGTGLEKITHDDTFDSFPMFSPDGTKIVFGSNRNNGGTRDTNMFIADWVE